MPPLLRFVAGCLATSLPILALIRWYRARPRTSREWLDRQGPDDPFERYALTKHRTALFTFLSLLFLWGLMAVQESWEALRP